MRVVSAETMRELDRRTIAAGTPGQELMRRAGRGAWEALCRLAAELRLDRDTRLVVVAGKGNNGGDGYVLADLAHDAPWGQVLVYALAPVSQLSGDARYHAEAALAHGVTVIDAPDGPPADVFRPTDLIVDAMLGTGASGPLRPPYHAWVRAINASGAPVVALDLPTGVDADTGALHGEAVRADLTVAFALPKPGLLLGLGADHAGRLAVVDIGIPEAFVAETEAGLEAFTAADARPLLGRLPVQAHKSERGRILVASGHRDYPGAPLLAAGGALRLGGGLVTVAYPEAAAPFLGPRPHALILRAIADGGHGRHGPAGLAALQALAAATDCAVIGPGLGRHPDTLAVAAAIAALPRRLVLDADGLTLLVEDRLQRPPGAVTVLTPHAGEFRRIAEARGDVAILTADRLTQARWLARLAQAIVVLKGPRSVVAAPDGRLSLNTSGSAALATGGTGDVLAGLIAASLCAQPDPFAAVCLAVFVHGRAGEQPPSRRAFIADDLLERIGPTLAELSPFA